jgi:hypothetical protein
MSALPRTGIKRWLKERLTIMGLPKGACEQFYSEVSFWRPERVIQSAWIEHAPFAFWLTAKHRPRTIVELGSARGYSLLCFCQAVKKLGCDTKVYAIDTWKGDDHAGLYGEKVFDELRSYHEPRYSKFSTMIRSTFDEALSRFDDGSIDLLHIDGRHYYDDVKHDFNAWRPKLSPRAVVLFHDTRVSDREFGVSQLWSEISPHAPSFEFWHGQGLGVLGYGPDVPLPISSLLKLPADGEVARSVREVYRRLGAVCWAGFPGLQRAT